MDNGTRLTSTLVHDLFLAGVIPRRQYYQAIAYARDNTVWGQWGLRVLLALGVGQMLAGIIFFFAFNWVDLSPFAKLGLIQGGIVLCAAIAWLAGLDGLVGKASLAAAAVLVGVVLAVYGQIYQTGADAYQLFTGWTVLIIPWVLVSRNAALWLLWLLVGNIALYTFSVQIALPEGWTTWPMVHCGLGVANLLSLVAVELAVKQGTGWLENRWLRPVLLFAALVLLFIPAVNSVLGPWKLIEPVAVGLLIAVVLGTGSIYLWWRFDFAMFSLITLFGCLFLCAIAFKLLVLEYDVDTLSLLILTLLYIGIFGVASLLLRWARGLVRVPCAP